MTRKGRSDAASPAASPRGAPDRGPNGAPAVPRDVLNAVAAAGADDAGGLDVALLGDFLGALSGAVSAGRPLTRRQMAAYRDIGGDAARQGVALRALLDLYLSAAWRLWRHLPEIGNAAADPAAVVTAGEVMLHAVDDAVAAVAEGFQLARRDLVRAEESARREFIDDLLAGGREVESVLRRAAGYGLDLSGPHAVAVVVGDRAFVDGTPVIGSVERAVRGSKGDALVLVASKDDRLVVVFPAPDASAVDQVVGRTQTALGSRPRKAPGSRRMPGGVAPRHSPLGYGSWRIGVGRPGVGPHGVAGSYRDAIDALDLSRRLRIEAPVVHARDLLVFNVVLRDRTAISELVDSVLDPLRAVRGGPRGLLDTLAAYFDSGGNASRTARELHLSVRAVTYRLTRVRSLTGLDPTSPADAFALRVAVVGARLLDWPDGTDS